MNKVFTIAQKELYSAYTDRPRLMLMLAAPLMIAIILGLAFGGQGGNLGISDIPVAVVNLDEGAPDGTNYGATIASILLSEPTDDGQAGTCTLSTEATPTDMQSLDMYLNAERLDTIEAAHLGVDDGTYAAAVIIPAGFSEALAPEMTNFSGDTTIESTRIEIYGSGAQPVSASVVRSITEGITSSIVTGSTTIRASIQTYVSNPLNIAALMAADEAAFTDFSCGFDPTISTIKIAQQPLDDVQARNTFQQILIMIGVAQALFFALTTANASVQSIYEDRKTGVLQRLLVSPTPRVTILAGKLVGMLLVVFVQISVLLLALTVVASMNAGAGVWLWGNPFLVFALLVIVSISVSGVAVFVVGIARTQEQAQIVGTLVALALAILGGSFGFQLGDVSKFSLIWWGTDGFNTLSAGSTAIGLSVLVLLAQGVLLFALGSWLFNRRVTV